MNLPDPDDPHFRAEMRELTGCLFGASLFVFAVLCIGIAYLSP